MSVIYISFGFKLDSDRQTDRKTGNQKDRKREKERVILPIRLKESEI